MEEQEKPLRVMEFLFGEAAQVANKETWERMGRWRRAYEEWLEERKRRYKKNTIKQSKLAWKRLGGQCGKAPWEMTKELTRWVEIYSSGCVRLVKMMKQEEGSSGQLAAYVQERLDVALKRVVEILGLDKDFNH